MYLTDVFTLVYIQIETNNTQQIMNKLDVFSLFLLPSVYTQSVFYSPGRYQKKNRIQSSE